MRILSYPKDRKQIERLFQKKAENDAEAEKSVREIIDLVRSKGDSAVANLTRRFDRVRILPKRFRIPTSVLKSAWNSLDRDLRKALESARDRISAYHQHQKMEGFTYRDSLGNRMDQRVIPLQRVGVYVPGGTAAYPSTVLMDIIPAKIAGVDEVVLLTPPGQLKESGGQAALGAAYLAGADEVISVSGTAGVAALALGTETIRRVDKIVGPGNKYIATAKRLLYGEIDIDMIAGPSEVLILADSSAPLSWVVADMLSQAEHDPDAQAMVVLIGESDAKALLHEIRRQASTAPRAEAIQKSLEQNGAIIFVSSPDDAVELANLKAPEHLEIMTRNPRALANRVRNAGAIFLGRYTPEALGDYAAGPNHTLPTGGTARFFSPLSVWSFQKTSHIVECSKNGFGALADTVETLARTEGLFAHAASVAIRRK